jgi:hypothetical protein
MVLAVEKSELGARMCSELRRTGFAVAAACPAFHIIRQAKTADQTFAFSWLMPFLTLVRAMRRWQPALVICVDDLAVRIVQSLHHRLVRSRLETAKERDHVDRAGAWNTLSSNSGDRRRNGPLS